MDQGKAMSGKITNKWVKIGIALNFLALFCWVVMFLAGTDVWHDTGSHDFWNLQGSPYNDLRALAYAFYLLFLILIATLIVQFVQMRNR